MGNKSKRQLSKKKGASTKSKSLKKSKSKSLKKSKSSQFMDEMCCMCENNTTDKTNPLIPMKCLKKYGKFRAHKICSHCWWNKFAKENETHECPGCEKKIPIAKDPNAGIIIDLS
jgi:hypothetical protein